MHDLGRRGEGVGGAEISSRCNRPGPGILQSHTWGMWHDERSRTRGRPRPCCRCSPVLLQQMRRQHQASKYESTRVELALQPRPDPNVSHGIYGVECDFRSRGRCLRSPPQLAQTVPLKLLWAASGRPVRWLPYPAPGRGPSVASLLRSSWDRSQLSRQSRRRGSQ
jgi:hypothetical protein